MRKNRTLGVASLIGLVGALVACSASGDTPEEKRRAIQDMRSDTLQAFYEEDASLEQKVADAEGYGVFSNVGVNVIFVAGGGGYGVVHDNGSGDDTYMRMGEAGVGLGLGVKDFRALMIFHTDDAIDEFVGGEWTFGADADAAAKTGDKGGAASGEATTESGMSIYQLTESGLALQATLKGAKFWKSDELN